MLAVDEVFETNETDSSSVSLRLPPSPTGEGFFDMLKAKKSPARRGDNGFLVLFEVDG